MVHSDSQISMRSLHLIMLFTLVGYMSMTCLTKCFSWLVGVHVHISQILYILYKTFIKIG